MNKPTDSQYVQAAQRIHNDPGTCEVDNYDPKLTQVSRGGDLGAYVMAWVWVEEDEAHAEKS